MLWNVCRKVSPQEVDGVDHVEGGEGNAVEEDVDGTNREDGPGEHHPTG